MVQEKILRGNHGFSHEKDGLPWDSIPLIHDFLLSFRSLAPEDQLMDPEAFMDALYQAKPVGHPWTLAVQETSVF